MSSTTVPESATCSYCGGERDRHDSVHGSYCSERCYFRAKGEGILAQIESDRRICATCYGRVRDVARVPDVVSETASAFQYPTENTVIGVDDHEPDAGVEAIEHTRWSCRCGAVDPAERHAVLQNLDLAATIANFYHALAFLAEEDAIADEPDADAYYAALRLEWRDAAYAAGRAVYGAE